MNNPHLATQRFKNHLAYKLGLALIAYDKSKKAINTNPLHREFLSSRDSQIILSAGGGAIPPLLILS